MFPASRESLEGHLQGQAQHLQSFSVLCSFWVIALFFTSVPRILWPRVSGPSNTQTTLYSDCNSVFGYAMALELCTVWKFIMFFLHILGRACVYFIDMPRRSLGFAFARAYFSPRGGINGLGTALTCYTACVTLFHWANQQFTKQTESDWVAACFKTCTCSEKHDKMKLTIKCLLVDWWSLLALFDLLNF